MKPLGNALAWFCLLVLAVSAAEQPTFSGDVRIHDPSVIEVGGMYAAFYTGEEGGKFRGAIRVKSSPDGLVWHDAGAIGKGLPAWVKPTLGFLPHNIWAPSVSK